METSLSTDLKTDTRAGHSQKKASSYTKAGAKSGLDSSPQQSTEKAIPESQSAVPWAADLQSLETRMTTKIESSNELLLAAINSLRPSQGTTSSQQTSTPADAEETSDEDSPAGLKTTLRRQGISVSDSDDEYDARREPSRRQWLPHLFTMRHSSLD